MLQPNSRRTLGLLINELKHTADVQFLAPTIDLAENAMMGDAEADWKGTFRGQSLAKNEERLMHTRFGFAVAALGLGLLMFTPALAENTAQHPQRQTREDLRAAMADEAFTVLEYTAFAEHARKEGKTKLAELFEQKVKDEKRHFNDFSELYGLVREDWHNIAAAIVDEYVLKAKTYVQMAERAEAVGDKEVAKTFHDTAASENQHQADFQDSISKALKPDTP